MKKLFKRLFGKKSKLNTLEQKVFETKLGLDALERKVKDLEDRIDDLESGDAKRKEVSIGY